MTPPAPSPRAWWTHRGPLLALGVHLLLFLGCYPLRLTDAEYQRISDRVEHPARTREWARAIVQEKGPFGLVIWYFSVHDELKLYYRYAGVALHGTDSSLPRDDPRQGRLRPYRDVTIEYPPGSLLYMLPPALVSSDYGGYCDAFAVWTALVYLGALGLALRALSGPVPDPAHANRTLWWSVCFLLAFGGIVAARLDAVVALICALGLWIYARLERVGAGAAGYALLGGWAACGAMVKIVPGALAPAVVLCLVWGEARPDYRKAGALLAGCGAVLLLLHGAFYSLWGDGYLNCYRYHLARGTQIESTYSGVLLALRGLGRPYSVEYSFGSFNLVTPYASLFRALSPWLFLAGCALVAWRFRATRGSGVAMPAAAGVLLVEILLAFMLTNRVFSPQYVIWLGPLWAALCGCGVLPARLGLVFLAATGFTQAVFPHLYSGLLALVPAMVLVLNLRNLAVLALFALLLARPPRRA